MSDTGRTYTEDEVAGRVRDAVMDLNNALKIANAAGLQVELDIVDRSEMRHLTRLFYVNARISRPL